VGGNVYPSPAGLGAFLLFGANLDVPTAGSTGAEQFPPSVTWPAFAVFQQQASAFAPRPELTSPNDWAPSFPERYSIARLRAVDIQSVAFSPSPERTQALACSVFPDRAPPAPGPAEVRQTQSLLPERTQVLAATSFADRVDRVRQAETQQAFAPQLERTYPSASSLFSDSAARPAYEARQQPFVTGTAPSPELTLPSDWRAVYADRAPLPWSLPLPGHVGFAPLPERTSLIAATAYPDALPIRPTLPGIVAFAPSPEQRQSAGVASYPDAIRLPLPTHTQPVLTVVLAPPAPVMGTASYQDAIPLSRLSASAYPFASFVYLVVVQPGEGIGPRFLSMRFGIGF
jgi:hypothetical protein